MVHGDERGLVLPPKVAPIQVIMVPIAFHKEGVLDKAEAIYEGLKAAGFRVELDERDTQSAGWKFNEWEMKGVPIRLEIGPRDVEKNQVVLVRRDNHEKTFVPVEELTDTIHNMLEEIHKGLYDKALTMREENTHVAHDMDEFKDIVETRKGFIKAMWCGDVGCEDRIKDEFSLTARCIPFEQEKLADHCICCGEEAKHMVYFARAY